jgi:hypothetical protein
MSYAAQVGRRWRNSAEQSIGESADLSSAEKLFFCLPSHGEQPSRDPGARSSGPGFLFEVASLNIYAVPKSVPVKRTLTSYIRPEWNSCLGAGNRNNNNEEQLP